MNLFFSKLNFSPDVKYILNLGKCLNFNNNWAEIFLYWAAVA